MLRKTLAFTACFLFALSLFSQEKARVEYRSDLTKIHEQGAYIELIGNVAFHHNGTIITCDTAYRYSEQNMEGVGNVIINNDSTFIYGDRFTYNGETNIARIYAPLIKTVDKDAVMYTRNMEFNTLENKGSYYGGGTVAQRDNLMESDEGEYYTDTREVVLIGNVSMKNDNYEIKTDSIGFNLETELVTFYKKTDIWNHEGEFLIADHGTYSRPDEVYDFTKNAYILTEEQELWADSINYRSRENEAILKQNIQILDTVQMLLSFGDYGHYWGDVRHVIMTGNPSVISYADGESDSTFMRADTLWVFPALDLKDSVSQEISDSLSYDQVADSVLLQGSDSMAVSLPDSLSLEKTDSIKIVDTEELTARQLKRLAKEERKRQKAEERAAIREAKAEKREAKRKMYEELAALSEEADSVIQIPDSMQVDSLQLPLDSLIIGREKREADSSDYVIRGAHKVKIFRNDMQSICDSLVVMSVDSTIHMYNNPIVWNEENQITSRYIVIYTYNEQLDVAELYDFPIIAQKLEEEGRYNQIRGKFMEAYFKNNELDIVYIDGNAETRYYKEDSDGMLEALFTATSASMEITFDSSKLDRIKWISDVVSAIYPMDKIPDDLELNLEGFEWHGDLRPNSREEVFSRIIRPSFRIEAAKIERPVFEITRGIDEEKERLILEGIWRDRNEPLPIDRSVFILIDL